MRWCSFSWMAPPQIINHPSILASSGMTVTAHGRGLLVMVSIRAGPGRSDPNIDQAKTDIGGAAAKFWKGLVNTILSSHVLITQRLVSSPKGSSRILKKDS